MRFIKTLLLTDIFIFFLVTTLAVFPFNSDEKDFNFWNKLARKDLESSKARKILSKKAHNAILFIGDGMGVSTLTAARILKGQLAGKSGEESQLFLETFPDIALIKTYNVDKQVPDSAGTATAYLTGVKANFRTIGVGPNVNSSDTDCKKIKENSLDSIFESARKSGKAIGLVTTTRLTHATPAASYAHTPNREYEADIHLPEKIKEGGCTDIARQLFENQPGISFNVIFGGGRFYFIPKSNQTGGLREDGRNLINEWLKTKNESGLSKEKYKYVTNLKQLEALDIEKVDYVLGVFADDHLSYSANRLDQNEPSLNQMLQKAIQILSKNSNGYVLVVEGGRIDHAHHKNYAKLALFDTLEFDNSIEKAMNIIDKDNTLVVVTADHSHSLTINGYPERGNDIFGLSGYIDEKRNKSFTTLLYSSGPGHKQDYKNLNTISNYKNVNYQQYTTVEMKHSNHAGEDVALYATGPMSYLYRGLHEQNYIPHVICFSTCIGLYINETHCKT